MKYKNNPLNIRYFRLNNWKGQSGHKNGFCEFVSLDFGIRAAGYILMRSYRKRGVKTYSEIINAWAPPFENNTDSYLNFVLKEVNKFPWDIPTSLRDFADLIRAMWQFEQGNTINMPNPFYIVGIFKMYNLKQL